MSKTLAAFRKIKGSCCCYPGGMDTQKCHVIQIILSSGEAGDKNRTNTRSEAPAATTTFSSLQMICCFFTLIRIGTITDCSNTACASTDFLYAHTSLLNPICLCQRVIPVFPVISVIPAIGVERQFAERTVRLLRGKRWTLICFDRWSLRANFFSHTGHW